VALATPTNSVLAARLQAVQRRVKGIFGHLKEILGNLLNSLRNGAALDRPERHHLQDQHVERA